METEIVSALEQSTGENGCVESKEIIGGCRNKELNNIYSSPNINRVIKSVRIKQPGNSRLTWQDKMDLKEGDGKVWIGFIWFGIGTNDEHL
jgi:hypothetical protein